MFVSTRQADALRRILAENDLSQVDLSHAAKVNKNTLTNILKGGPTSTPVLERLTQAVNTVRRKRHLPDMDVAEWMATGAQAEAIRRVLTAESDSTRVGAILQQLAPQITQLIADQLSSAKGGPFKATPHQDEGVHQRRPSHRKQA